MNSKISFFERSYQLAKKGFYTTRPNPSVGALIVKEGEIIGEGFTSPVGGAHAEVGALKQAGSLTKGAECYVTLTPCSHYGRTPPCTEALILAGIKHIHIALRDPSFEINKNAVKVLKKAGLKVSFDYPQEVKDKCFKLIEDFLFSAYWKRPLITAKIALTLDGKMACQSGDSKWITSTMSRQHAHKIRASADAVLVGVNTLLQDDCKLNVRLKGKFLQPKSIILDTHGRTPPQAALLKNAETLIFSSKKGLKKLEKTLSNKNVTLYAVGLKKKFLNLQKICEILYKKHQIHHLLIEGGSLVLGSFFEDSLIDRLNLFYAPKILGDGSKAISPFAMTSTKKLISQAKNLEKISYQKIGPDFLISGEINAREISRVRSFVFRRS